MGTAQGITRHRGGNLQDLPFSLPHHVKLPPLLLWNTCLDGRDYVLGLMTFWGHVKAQMAPEKQDLEKPEEELQNKLLLVPVYHVSPLPLSTVCQSILGRNTVTTCHEQNYDFWSMKNFWSNVPSEPSSPMWALCPCLMARGPFTIYVGWTRGQVNVACGAKVCRNVSWRWFCGRQAGYHAVY